MHPSPLRTPDTPASPLPTPLTLHLCTVGASVPAPFKTAEKEWAWEEDPLSALNTAAWSVSGAGPTGPGAWPPPCPPVAGARAQLSQRALDSPASCRGAHPDHGVEGPDGRAEGTRSPWGRGKGFDSRFRRSKGTWVSSLILLRLGSGSRGWRAGGTPSNSGVLGDPAGGRWAGWLGTEEEPS